jgi:hypothetical protein
MTTPLDIITQALKKAGVLGVGQTPLAEDTNDAFNDLQDMLGQWQRKRWLVWCLVDYACTGTGAVSYTVGPAGQFNINPRPDKIESAFFRQIINQSVPNQIDYPLEIIESREDYNRIGLKQLQSFPQYLFYDSQFPTANAFPWPLIQANLYELHLTVKQTLNQFTSLSQTINMPLEYMAALKFNLALRLRQAYQLPPDTTLIGLAKDSLNVIRNANLQIPRLLMPEGLTRGHGLYNVFSDSYY